MSSQALTGFLGLALASSQPEDEKSANSPTSMNVYAFTNHN
ncbi:hypothetical protein [Nostoc sp.]